MSGKYVGLSLSFCVRDIVLGYVPLNAVEKVIAGTAAENESGWQHVLAVYSETYWSQYSEQAREVARNLINSQRIEQPRLTDPMWEQKLHRGHWVKDGVPWMPPYGE
jgi:hypothetical protein